MFMILDSVTDILSIPPYLPLSQLEFRHLYMTDALSRGN